MAESEGRRELHGFGRADAFDLRQFRDGAPRQPHEDPYFARSWRATIDGVRAFHAGAQQDGDQFAVAQARRAEARELLARTLLLGQFVDPQGRHSANLGDADAGAKRKLQPKTARSCRRASLTKAAQRVAIFVLRHDLELRLGFAEHLAAGGDGAFHRPGLAMARSARARMSRSLAIEDDLAEAMPLGVVARSGADAGSGRVSLPLRRSLPSVLPGFGFVAGEVQHVVVNLIGRAEPQPEDAQRADHLRRRFIDESAQFAWRRQRAPPSSSR